MLLLTSYCLIARSVVCIVRCRRSMSKNTSTDIWIAGAFAAFTVDLLVYPLDTLKTRIQSPDYKKLFLKEGTNNVNRAALFRGLYQGITGVVLATLPSCRSTVNTAPPRSGGADPMQQEHSLPPTKASKPSAQDTILTASFLRPSYTLSPPVPLSWSHVPFLPQPK